MASYGKFKEWLLPNVVFCVSQDNEGQTSRDMSLDESLLSKTPVNKILCGNLYKGSAFVANLLKDAFVENL